MKKFSVLFTTTALITFSIACNNPDGNNSSTGNNATTVPSTVDSMPVLDPGNFDSSSIINTPPTNDNNAIVPDTTRKGI